MPFTPILDFSQWGSVTGEVIYSYSITDSRQFYVGYPGVPSTGPLCTKAGTINYANAGGASVAVSNVKRISAVTVDMVSGADLSASIGYNYLSCGIVGTFPLSRNGYFRIDRPDGTSSRSSFLWTSNLTKANPYFGVNSTHGTSVSGFILTQNVPGLGNAGDSVYEQGLQWMYNNPGAVRDRGIKCDVNGCVNSI